MNNTTSKKNKTYSRRRKKSKSRFLIWTIAIGLCVLMTATAVKLASRSFDLSRNVHNSGSSDNSLTSAINDTSESSWCLILVNKWNYIPENYDVELTRLKNGEEIDKRIYPALQGMFDAARKNGIYPIVASGYRTAERQQELMDEKTAEYKAQGYSADESKAKAEAWVAVPGTSEHQLGLGVDINADGIHSTGDQVYKWLEQNCYKFGFIRRYPPDKTDITGVINEPWHYRYVGVTAATQIHEQGICLEEFLEKEN